jgi:hypothetical protein
MSDLDSVYAASENAECGFGKRRVFENPAGLDASPDFMGAASLAIDQ